MKDMDIIPALNLRTLHGMKENRHFWFKYDFDRSAKHPKFDPIGVRIHNMKIKTVHVMSLKCLTKPKNLGAVILLPFPHHMKMTIRGIFEPRMVV